jgi:protein-tyrosine phosphatase
LLAGALLTQVKDFDPWSLRKVLPSAVQALHEAVSQGGRVYVHCTAGLGRAPAVVIAYLYWFKGMDLPTVSLAASVAWNRE